MALQELQFLVIFLCLWKDAVAWGTHWQYGRGLLEESQHRQWQEARGVALACRGNKHRVPECLCGCSSCAMSALSKETRAGIPGVAVEARPGVVY